MRICRILAFWCFVLGATLSLSPVAQAQAEQTEVAFSAPQQDVEMADVLRQDGKIYVVVVVLLSVLAGTILYLITIDRKVSKLEKQLKDDLVNR